MGWGQHNYKPMQIYSSNNSIMKISICMAILHMPNSTLPYNLARNDTRYVLYEPAS